MNNRSGRTPKEELKKQLIDQPLHALWGFAGGLLPFPLVHFFGPWAWFSVAATLGSCIGWAIREIKQAEDGSHTWWDPYLDSFVWLVAFVGGILTGIYTF